MKVLASGMGWITEQPGGLNRYFADYVSAWDHAGDVRGLVRVHGNVEQPKPPFVRGIHIKSRSPWGIRREWARAMRSELRAHRFDLYNPHFAYYAWAWSGLKVDLPVVTHFQGPWAYEGQVERMHSRSVVSALQFRMKRYIEQRAYRQSDQFIVLSRSFKDELANKYNISPERIHIIPAGVDVEKFHDADNRDHIRLQLGLPVNRFILLSVRRLARRMGLGNLIRAIADVRKDFPELLLVLVGGGELYKELTALVVQLNLVQHVLLTNRVPDERLSDYYRAADLTVVPSLALEGFGLTTVESMACGTPVAGTPQGGTKEILGQFRPDLLFAGSSTAHISEGLARLLARRSELPTRAVVRDHVLRRYTWDVVIPQIHAVFELATR